MGSFSYIRANRNTKIANFVEGDKIRLLIPKEFGGGYIDGYYLNYGDIGYYDEDENAIILYDIEEIRAFWNAEETLSDGRKIKDEIKRDLRLFSGWKASYPAVPPVNCYTDYNRHLGIDLKYAHDDRTNDEWEREDYQFPIKLVTPSYKGTYEDCEWTSKSDPEQGFGHHSWVWYKKRYACSLNPAFTKYFNGEH